MNIITILIRSYELMKNELVMNIKMIIDIQNEMQGRIISLINNRFNGK